MLGGKSRLHGLAALLSLQGSAITINDWGRMACNVTSHHMEAQTKPWLQRQICV